MSQYFVVRKPFGVTCQFSGEAPNLSSLGPFPRNVYPVGRLDKDSEGLLIITDDAHVHHRMTDPRFSHRRTYWVQVEGVPDEAALQKLRNGVEISLPEKRRYLTLPCSALLLETPPVLPPRNPPVRYRKTVPDSWLSVSLQEGKNRQVRKMTAAVGFPTLRLVRCAIENLRLEHLHGADVRSFDKNELYQLLGL